MNQVIPKTSGSVSLSLCDLKEAKDRLTGLSLVTCVKTAISGSKAEAERRNLVGLAAVESEKTDVAMVEIDLAVSEKMSCSFCDVEFKDREEQVEHYKSDMHRFNLKQRLRGLPPITEQDFEDIADNMSSSLSGSDSSSDEEESLTDNDQDGSNKLIQVEGIPDEQTEVVEPPAGRTPMVYFQNEDGELLSMYRCVLHGKKNIPETDAELLTLAQASPLNPHWAILMVGGGHFAAAIFDREEITEHKTFHRYTVRAKRGTAQGMRDSQGNAPKSAGASIRRHNEAALIQETQELLQSWSEQLKKCSVIFLRAPSYNRSLFFGHKNPPFDKNDKRIRTIPFATRRPTFNEVKRVHGVLSTYINYGLAEDVDLNLIKSPPRVKEKKVPAPKKQLQTVEKFIKQTTRSSENAKSAANDESSEDEGGEIELRYVKEILTTIDLKMFEITRKPKRRNKKKKKKDRMEEDFDDMVEADGADTEDSNETGDVVVSELDASKDTELDHIQNELYTASRTGNQASLEESLKSLHEYVNKAISQEISQESVPKVEDLGEDVDHAIPVNTSVLSSNSDNQCTGTNIDDSSSHDELSREQESELIKDGAERFLSVLNRTFGDQKETLLHVSSRTGRANTVFVLLEAGADPCVRNGNKLPAYAAATSKEVRNAFRRFMGKYPEKHDYTLAQIPAPLTEEMETERKAKEAERKKAAKKAKQERMKDVKAKEAETQAEEREKKRYLNLSDREKRALAAEKRLVKQVEETTGAKPVLSRCWHCGIDITGKTPFEYFDYKFCTTKCLKSHRAANQETKS